MGPGPARGHRRDRRLQGVRALPAARQGGPRRRAAASPRAPSGSSPRETFARSRARAARDDLYPHLTRADLLVVAPLHGEHARQARARASPTTCSPRPRSPPRAGPRRAGDEPAHVGAPRDAARTPRRSAPRGVVLSARTRASSPRASRASAGWRSRRRSSRAPRAARRRRAARRASASSSRRAGRASRSTPSASSATARRDGWASRSPRRRAGAARDVTLLAANLAVAGSARRRASSQTPTAAAMLEREALARADADVVIMAAAVADYRPAERDRRQAAEGRAGGRVELEPTVDILRELGARAANGQVLVGFAAEQGEDGLARSGRKLATKNADLVVFNDVGAHGHRLRRRRQRGRARSADGGERHVAGRPRRSDRRRGPRRGRALLASCELTEVYDLFQEGRPPLRSGSPRRPRCRSRRRSAASRTRPRSARRSASRTSGSGATRRPRRSSGPCSRSPRSTTTRTTHSAAASRSRPDDRGERALQARPLAPPGRGDVCLARARPRLIALSRRPEHSSETLVILVSVSSNRR